MHQVSNDFHQKRLYFHWATRENTAPRWFGKTLAVSQSRFRGRGLGCRDLGNGKSGFDKTLAVSRPGWLVFAWTEAMGGATVPSSSNNSEL